MRPKTKSFLEDMFIILIIGALIYGIYFIFFSSTNEEEIVQNKPIIETKIEKEIVENKITKNEEEQIQTQEVPKIEENQTVDENKQTQEIETQEITTENSIQNESQEIAPKQEEINISEPIKQIQTKATIEENITEKPIEQTQKENLKEVSIKPFYASIEKEIYSNINKNIKDEQLKNKDTNIRVTILQNGKYEQLTFISGDKKFYELLKPSILEVFPLKIDESIKSNFPRYFRMKIEY